MLSRRATVFAGIVLLHVGFIYVLNAGLATQAVEIVFGPIETKMIEDVKEEKNEAAATTAQDRCRPAAIRPAARYRHRPAR